MNDANDIIFSVSSEGLITHAIIGGEIFFNDRQTRAMVTEAIHIEREACARMILDRWGGAGPAHWSEMVAAAIRARKGD
jgi:hypothetical protein